MASIYIHIPFCKTRCIYCGFFSTTSLEKREMYIEAVCEELSVRKDYLKDEIIDSIYFGGGTPSQLSVFQISEVLKTIHYIYNVREDAEITMEANPDDLSLAFLSQLREAGINRLSMGLQSFDDSRLKFIRRRHSASQAIDAVYDAIKAGFDNISIDLMFGFPGQTIEEWRTDVDKALSLPIRHLSAYSLMYDEGTVLAKMLDEGEIEEIDEEMSLKMYRYLVEKTKEFGFEHYEISNFALPGFRSRHNSGYWSGVKYLGVGAGAHSYDGESRQYNPDSLELYMKKSEPVKEELTDAERYNEFVFTGLRTREGLSLSSLKEKFGVFYDYCMENARKHIDAKRLMLTSGSESYLRLTSTGIFVSNDIMSDLMVVDE